MRSNPAQSRTVSATLTAVLLASVGPLSASEVPTAVRELVRSTCLDCHDTQTREGGLDLETLSPNLTGEDIFATWVKIHDRVSAGEMPPADVGPLAAADRQQLVTPLADRLRQVNLARQRLQGRVQYRRLNRTEYEQTIRDLLGLPHLEIKEILPVDSSAHGFDNVGAALDLSYVQLARYLEAADEALAAAMVLGPRPETETTRLHAMTNGRFSQVVNKGKEAVPIGDSVGLLRQPNTAQAPWWWSKYDPPIDGQYRLRMKTFGFSWDKGEVLPADETHVVTLQARHGSSVRPLGSFDVPRSQQQADVLELVTFLRPGDQVQVHLATLDDRNKPGQMDMQDYAAPGVAVEWLEIEGPLIDRWPPPGYQRLFGDLPSQPFSSETGLREPPIPIITDGVGKRARRMPAKRGKFTPYHVVSVQPIEDARRLLQSFAERAFRRPVHPDELTDVLALVHERIEQKYCFQEALRIGYQTILCAPEFLFLQESPGPLDDYALASRLSYFLWNSLPDEPLLSLAARSRLHEPAVLDEQVERMLDDPKAERFVETFCGQWLDLRRITITQPDEQLYPEFDQLLLDSMVAESQAYFRAMLAEDLGATSLVDSDFVMINRRLAELYGIPGVEGVAIRRVPLPEQSPRGGFLTQASILKVTANGTTTSPVTRGAWVLDQLLGQPAPLPPPNIPAVEPDLRGITTIRQQLARHRDDASCAACHQRIDPPGFALESFDVVGGWRERYRSLEQGDPVQKTFKGDRPVPYKLGPTVDPSGTAPGGESFEDIHGFRQILLKQQEQLARNLAGRLLVYATGAGIEFADRTTLEQILDQTRPGGYGLRSMIYAVVRSDLFQSK